MVPPPAKTSLLNWPGFLLVPILVLSKRAQWMSTTTPMHTHTHTHVSFRSTIQEIFSAPPLPCGGAQDEYKHRPT